MPFFKTTQNIFKDNGEYFNPDWMNYDTIQTPPKKNWDYKEELTIEKVNLWEVIAEASWGVYAAWDPYAEFYMVVPPYWENKNSLEVYYGKGASFQIAKRMKELGFAVPKNKIWVDSDMMWLYSDN
jgi:hypothetical protein